MGGFRMSFSHRIALIPLNICNLSSSAKNLLIHLAAHAEWHPGNDFGKRIFPCRKTMHELTGYSLSHIDKNLKELLNEKVLTKANNNAKDKPSVHNRKTCWYELNLSILDKWESILKKLKSSTSASLSRPERGLELDIAEVQATPEGGHNLCTTYSNTYKEDNPPPKSVSSSKNKTAKQPSRQEEQEPRFSLPSHLFSFEDFKTIAREMEIHSSNDQDQYNKLLEKKWHESKTKSEWEKYVRVHWLDKENLRQPNPKQLRQIMPVHLDLESDSEQERNQKEKRREDVFAWCNDNLNTRYVKVVVESHGGIKECRERGFPKFDDFMDSQIV